MTGMTGAVEVLGLCISVVITSLVVARVVFAVPRTMNRTNSIAPDPAEHGPVAAGVARQAVGKDGSTGIAMLRDGTDAFAARLLLADRAVSAIDAQYYMWKSDMTGMLLLDALRRAADRGVRVRLLLDDAGTDGLDPEIAALDVHPMIEVRLWNPFNLRRVKALSYTFDFLRLNRRMHNKSFAVDGCAAVLGGRNIGDEYFDTGERPFFVDLDVLAVGAILPAVAQDFDRYWAANAAVPAGPVVGATRPGSDPVGSRMADLQGDPKLAAYRAEIAACDLATALDAGALDLDWMRATLVSDTPEKGSRAIPQRDLLASQLTRIAGESRERFDGVSPYFVPGAQGVAALVALRERGVAVRILTNSLEATDVVAVHSGYAKWRRRMLRAGIGLFELQKQAAADVPDARKGPFRVSGASLHAKTFASDGRRVFVGSFNFDPRSISLNTEMGLMLDSARIAQEVHDALDARIHGMAWLVELRGRDLVWADPAGTLVRTREPGSTWRRRVQLVVVEWLPVEWLL